MPSNLREKAAALAKKHRFRDPLVIDSAEARDPNSGKPVHRFRVVSAANANGPALSLYLNAHGEEAEASDALRRVFDRSVLGVKGASAAAPVTIQPDTNALTLNPGQIFDENLTVTIPKNAGPVKADVYFLADTTGSMSGILSAVQAGANNVLAALAALPVDIVFGVGNYKDFAQGDPYGFQHQASPTNVTATVMAAINAWSASGGGDIPEAALFALNSLAVPPGPGIGWRAGSNRIIVWFGDAPSHDPICTVVSGAPTVTEASATANLVAQGTSVLAVSTATPGLDGDPKVNANGYGGQCGAPSGLPGQATRIINASGGTLATGINAGNIVNTIINLVKAAVGEIQNVNLVPSPSVAPFVTSITPPGGYGPLAGDQNNTLTFDVKFTGIPCQAKDQVVTGTIDVVADGKTLASKRVQITVPACAFTYSVKFICGVQPECGCDCAPVQPGTYATEINIHNYSLKPVEIVKRFVPLVLAGAPAGREPNSASARAEDRITLPAQTATMDDCCRIAELIFGEKPASPVPLIIGLLELTASADIAVTAVYTTSGTKPHGGVAIELQQVPRR
jgi:hypothetical protein